MGTAKDLGTNLGNNSFCFFRLRTCAVPSQTLLTSAFTILLELYITMTTRHMALPVFVKDFTPTTAMSACTVHITSYSSRMHKQHKNPMLQHTSNKFTIRNEWQDCFTITGNKHCDMPVCLIYSCPCAIYHVQQAVIKPVNKCSPPAMSSQSQC